MTEILIRFLIGGVVVSAFGVLADMLNPKSFAGLFGAAPSVALATLGLTIATEGVSHARSKAYSMMAGASAFFCMLPLVSGGYADLADRVGGPVESSKAGMSAPICF